MLVIDASMSKAFDFSTKILLGLEVKNIVGMRLRRECGFEKTLEFPRLELE